MKVALWPVLGLLFLLYGCLPASRLTRPVAVAEGEAPQVALWQPCTLAEARSLAAAAEQDPTAALQGAACYATLVEKQGGDLSAARAGRALAEQAAAAFPTSGTAHYLAGYLAGLEAQRAPLQALPLVKVIEAAALKALQLDPVLDHAGPARMLGDLYLRAPAFPVSIGDPDQAVTYFREAVRRAADFTENRLGLAEALLAIEEPAAACSELTEAWRQLQSAADAEGLGRRTLELQQRLCTAIGGT
ncbi:hypothetical protein [Desulfuromonas sp. CSMB_57]|jgi:hypothetical protein|uniref:tetratricopeptide repeat protein n=1 Tax=Desulfuromonas sp. CSMB_57 TaxID=2807629 RepID=UPI001CD4FAA9|nr:hypothetical protein [Desulfuromonas sp. CSMB_57]